MELWKQDLGLTIKNKQYCYVTHELHLYQNNKCKKFFSILVFLVRFHNLIPWNENTKNETQHSTEEYIPCELSMYLVTEINL